MMEAQLYWYSSKLNKKDFSVIPVVIMLDIKLFPSVPTTMERKRERQRESGNRYMYQNFGILAAYKFFSVLLLLTTPLLYIYDYTDPYI